VRGEAGAKRTVAFQPSALHQSCCTHCASSPDVNALCLVCDGGPTLLSQHLISLPQQYRTFRGVYFGRVWAR